MPIQFPESERFDPSWKHQLLTQRREDTIDLNHLTIDVPNSTTVEGLTALAENVQAALYLAETDRDLPNALSHRLNPLRARFGAGALTATLRGKVFDEQWVADHLNWWLKPKNLTVALAKPDVPMFRSWTRGWPNPGHPETDHYYNRDRLLAEPGRIARIFGFIGGHARRMLVHPHPEDVQIVRFIEAVARTLDEEIMSIGDDKPLPKARYRLLLEKPLRALGLTLVPSKKQ